MGRYRAVAVVLAVLGASCAGPTDVPRASSPTAAPAATLAATAAAGGTIPFVVTPAPPTAPASLFGGGRPEPSKTLAPGVRRLTEAEVGLRSIRLSGAPPNALAVDPESGLVYVANNGSVIGGCRGGIGAASVLGTGTPRPLPPLPPGANTLSIVDPAAGREIAFVPTGRGPIWPAVDARRDVVYVATGSEVSVHARGTGAAIARIFHGGNAHGLGLDPETGILMVANSNDLMSATYVAAVDVNTRRVLAHHLISRLPHSVVVDAARHRAYIYALEQAIVWVADTTTGAIIDKIETGSDITGSGLALSARTGRLFVGKAATGASPSNVWAFSVGTKQLIGKIPNWYDPPTTLASGMEVDEERGLLFVALSGASVGVGVADAETLRPLAVIPVDECPFAVRLDLARGLGFSTGQPDSMLSVFDIRRVAAALGR